MTYRFPDVEGQPQVLPAPFVKMSVARPSCVMMVSFIFLIMTLFFQKRKAFPGSAFHGGHGARVVCVGTLLAWLQQSPGSRHGLNSLKRRLRVGL